MAKRPRELDWIAALDFDAALVTLHYEMQGDWYRDPWGWPELKWVCKPANGSRIVARLNSTGVKRAAKIDVPKENFGTRPAIVMDPLDRLIYQALVDRESVKLVGKLPDWVYGWRLVPKKPKAGVWSHNSGQHKRFREHLNVAAALSDAALKTDIVSFFASIDAERLCEVVGTRCGSSKPVDRLQEMILGWSEMPGRSGLAQRSSASAALANMFLEPVDEMLRGYVPRSKARRGVLSDLLATPRVARWMDDIWLFGNDAGKLRRSQLAVQDALRSVGLEMNHSKTKLLEGSAVAEEAMKVQHSAIDGALLDTPADYAPLQELVDELLDNPTESDRTSVKFVTRRMREQNYYAPVPDFAERAQEMPHVADALARLFRDSEHWRDMCPWYCDYSKSPWGDVRWSVAQMGTMFPSVVPAKKATQNKLKPVKKLFADLLTKPGPMPLLALAAQRLAAWDPSEARPILRDAAEAADHPLNRRVFALAGVMAGEERAVTRRVLSEFEENAVTRDMLAAESYRVRAKADFSGT